MNQRRRRHFMSYMALFSYTNFDNWAYQLRMFRTPVVSTACASKFSDEHLRSAVVHNGCSPTTFQRVGARIPDPLAPNGCFDLRKSIPLGEMAEYPSRAYHTDDSIESVLRKQGEILDKAAFSLHRNMVRAWGGVLPGGPRRGPNKVSRVYVYNRFGLTTISMADARGGQITSRSMVFCPDQRTRLLPEPLFTGIQAILTRLGSVGDI